MAPRSALAKDDTAKARAALGKALDAGNLDEVRVAWTIWLDRNVSQTVEIKKGKMVRYGGVQKNERKERVLTDPEKKELVGALRDANAPKLVWINRDVKNQYDRVLNIDMLKADGSSDPVGAFVRTKTIWSRPPTDKLFALLEKWLQPDL
jgi:hypothetical protein